MKASQLEKLIQYRMNADSKIDALTAERNALAEEVERLKASLAGEINLAKQMDYELTDLCLQRQQLTAQRDGLLAALEPFKKAVGNSAIWIGVEPKHFIDDGDIRRAAIAACQTGEEAKP